MITENSTGVFEVPSGASTGVFEAHELRDEDGKGVLKAIDIIENDIKSMLVGVDVHDQVGIDKKLIELDGTQNKSKLGGNSMIGVSIATARAGAHEDGVELFEYIRDLSTHSHTQKQPVLCANMINGGKHANYGSPFQEHWVLIRGEDITQDVKILQDIQKKVIEFIEAEKKDYDLGDEGGAVVEVKDVFESFAILRDAIVALGLDFELGTDIAASSFYENGAYQLFEEKKTSEEMFDIYKKLYDEYKVTHFEDPFEENDFESFAKLREILPEATVIGDDLTTTNIERVKRAEEIGSINGVIIKANQIGTLSETIEVIEYAHDHGMKCIVSHRSGETNDTFIADLTRAFYCYGMKSGVWGQQEREVKYKRLMKLYS